MAGTVKNQEALNNLLKQILLSVFEQAGEEFEERSGKKLKLTSLQNMKYKTAQRLVNMGMSRLDKLKPEQQFERFSKLTNEHLPTVVGIVGEDVIVGRLQKVPKDVLNAEIVRSLDEAGAHELAELLGKATPGWQTAQPAVAVKPEVPIKPISAPAAQPVVEITELPDVESPREGGSLGALKAQLSLMKEFRAQVDESIGQLETAIASEERKGVSLKGPQP